MPLPRGYSTLITIAGATVGVNTVAYTAGDLLGSKLVLASVARRAEFPVVLENVIIRDLTAQGAAMDLILFNADPSATTFTNNVALTVADADIPKIVGMAKVVAGDYSAFAANSIAMIETDILVKPASGTGLWAALVARGTPTYVANELSIAFSFRQL